MNQAQATPATAEHILVIYGEVLFGGCAVNCLLLPVEDIKKASEVVGMDENLEHAFEQVTGLTRDQITFYDKRIRRNAYGALLRTLN